MGASQGEERRLRAGTTADGLASNPGCPASWLCAPSGFLVFNLSELRVYICKMRAKTAPPLQGCTDGTTQRQLSLESCPALSWPFVAPGKALRDF